MRSLSIVLVLAAAARAEPLDRHHWSRAVETTTGHYVVRTNTYPEIGRDLAARLEEAYAFFEDRFGPLEGKARLPMRLSLFATEEQYMTHGGGVAGAVGHFDAALDRCAIVWDGATGRTGWPVAVHEACHHYLRRRHPSASLPSWYAEGIACYFEGVLDPSTERSISRMRIASARAALRNGDADLALLLSTRATVRKGRLVLSNFSAPRFYALAWSFVHFLATDARYRSAFRRLELRLFASRPLPSRVGARARLLLEDECGDLATLQNRWHDHLRGLTRPARPRTPAVDAWELSARNAFVRYDAVRRLGRGRPPDAVRKELVARLEDSDLFVRRAACALLQRHMGADAVAGMTAALDAKDAPLKERALEALAHPAATAAVPRLLREREMRDRALRALAAIRDPRARPALRAALDDRMLEARTRARCAAALDDDFESMAALRAAAEDDELLVRSAARGALLRLERKYPETPARSPKTASARDVNVPRLLQVLASATIDTGVQVRACRALADAGVEEAVPALRRLCRPHVPDRVRLAAVRALVRLTGETRGFEPAQSARDREAAYRAWAQ